MIDTAEVMRAIVLELAPQEHRGLSFEELSKIGYGKNAALQIAKAYEENKNK